MVVYIHTSSVLNLSDWCTISLRSDIRDGHSGDVVMLDDE